MEDFSQSRGDDDLFDDEIIPIENPPSPEKIATQLEQVSIEPVKVPPPVEPVSVPIPAPQAAKTPTSNATDAPFPGFRQNLRGRGGQQTGRGGGPRKPSAGLEDSKWAIAKPSEPARLATKTNKPTKPPVANDARASPTQGDITDTTPTEAQPQFSTADSTITPIESTIPTGPSSTTQPTKTPAVRGDRTLTGGPARTKLTEEELSAKLAAAKERSQNLAAAHARAQADAASFEERERLAGVKRAVEKKERRVMEGERERNRMRKMGAREGREWDRDKGDVTANGQGRGRGGYAEYGSKGFTDGQTEEDDLGQYEWHDDRGRGRGRGRGGRGGRGRGRGSSRGAGHEGWDQQHQPDVSAETDFPALPGRSLSTSKNAQPTKEPSLSKSPANDTSKPAPQRWDSAGGGGGTWADQVESSELN